MTHVPLHKFLDKLHSIFLWVFVYLDICQGTIQALEITN